QGLLGETEGPLQVGQALPHGVVGPFRRGLLRPCRGGEYQRGRKRERDAAQRPSAGHQQTLPRPVEGESERSSEPAATPSTYGKQRGQPRSDRGGPGKTDKALDFRAGPSSNAPGGPGARGKALRQSPADGPRLPTSIPSPTCFPRGRLVPRIPTSDLRLA